LIASVRFALVIALLLFLAACGQREEPVSETSTSPSQTPVEPAPPPAPAGGSSGTTLDDYAATSLDGTPFSLAAQRDKIVLLNLWATWCGPCRFEIPELQTIHNRYADQGFAVIGVSVDESGAEAVRSFANSYKMTYPIVLDPQGRMATILQTTVLPTTVLLNRKGEIVWKRYGAIPAGDAELKAAVEAALAAS
jgi:thiol-disulfide isomerase/thioredoxin